VDIKRVFKKIWLSIYKPERLILPDYPVTPLRLYDETVKGPHKLLYEIINSNRACYESVLKGALKYKENIFEIKEDKYVINDTEPGWNNGYFPGLDIIMLYSLLSEINPKTYLEIGSGTSTCVAYKAKNDNNLSFTISSIDPFPRKEINNIADKVERKDLQKSSLEYFHSLNEGDILFFDGTHTLYPNSDVMWFFLEILPILKKGVYVQLHDIYLPYDYPLFMCDRYYNEQYILAACLLNNPGRYKIICPNYFIYTEKELHNILQPYWNDVRFNNIEAHGGSFWMKIE
jgi:Methyltransferase domain